jgi:hypothetical protein
MKAKVMSSKYSALCMTKLKEHLVAMCVAEKDMFRKPVNSARLVSAAAVGVGDWVQVDADRSPGWNSEVGIAMVIASSENKAEVKCVVPFYHDLSITNTTVSSHTFSLRYIHTRRVENTLSRLTTIVMPHRNEKATLKPKMATRLTPEEPISASTFQSMTTMDILGHGLASSLHRKFGWLKDLLIAEGTYMQLRLFKVQGFKF